MSIWPDWLPEFWRGFIDAVGIMLGLIAIYNKLPKKKR